MDNATKEKLMVSNTYIPGTTTAFIMNHIEADQRNKRVQEEEKDAWMDNDVVKIGLSNGCTTNKLCKDLLIDLELSSIDNSTICKIYLDWICWFCRLVPSLQVYTQFQSVIKPCGRRTVTLFQFCNGFS